MKGKLTLKQFFEEYVYTRTEWTPQQGCPPIGSRITKTLNKRLCFQLKAQNNRELLSQSVLMLCSDYSLLVIILCSNHMSIFPLIQQQELKNITASQQLVKTKVKLLQKSNKLALKMSVEVTEVTENFTEYFYELFPNVNGSQNASENMLLSYSLPRLEACDSWKQYLLTTLYLLTSLFSFIGNIVSIVVLIVGKRSSPELKKYLINLSISDILMALFSIPFTYTDFMLGRWVLPSILCPFAQFITIFSLCASVVTLTAIAIERSVHFNSQK